MRIRPLVLVLAALSCGDTTPAPPPPPVIDASVPRFDGAVPRFDAAVAPDAAVPTVVDVTASDALMFSPANITITRGTTVRWTNRGTVAHTVTSGTGSNNNPGRMFDQPLPAGATFTFTFTTAGTFPYFCRIHEAMNMRGTITVQ